MTIVCDSSALITLALVDRLPILKQLFGSVFIPRGVYNEVAVRGAGKTGADAVRGASFITVVEVARGNAPHNDLSLSNVDQDVIELARARRADLVITRDRRLLRRLRRQGIAAATVGDVLVVAKEKRQLESVKSVLDEMKQKGVLIRDATYHALLQEAGEE
jgi:predicted nucleic acid-binding protein